MRADKRAGAIMDSMNGRADALFRRAAWRLVPLILLMYIAAFLNRPGQWNGGDVCEFLSGEIVASGRRLLDADD